MWPVKIVPEMTYYVPSGTLNPTHSLMNNYHHIFLDLDCITELFKVRNDIILHYQMEDGWCSKEVKRIAIGKELLSNKKRSIVWFPEFVVEEKYCKSVGGEYYSG